MNSIAADGQRTRQPRAAWRVAAGDLQAAHRASRSCSRASPASRSRAARGLALVAAARRSPPRSSWPRARRARSTTWPSATSTRACRARARGRSSPARSPATRRWYLLVAALLVARRDRGGLGHQLAGGGLRVPRRVHLRRRLHAVAEAPHLAQHRDRRAGRQLRGARRCGGDRPDARTASAWVFAVVLFLWTPPHFWSLATYYRQDYADAGVPMLPVVHGDRVAALVILWSHGAAGAGVAAAARAGARAGSTASARWPAAATSSGARTCWSRSQTPSNAIRSFLASLLQLGLLLAGAIVEGAVRGSLVHF